MHTYIHILWDFLFALIRQNCIYQMIYRSIPLHYKFHLLLTKWPSIQWQISFHPNPLTLIVICCFIVSLFAVSDANVSLLYSVSASSTPFQQADEWQYYDSIKPILKYSSTACKMFAFFNISVVSNWYLLCFCKASASASIFYSCLWCQFKGHQD